MASESVLTVDQANFEEVVLRAEKPVLLDFWAPWCGPCRMVAPHIDAVADAMEGKALVGKINVDDNQALAIQYGVTSIPTLLILKDGKVVETMIGARGRADIEKALKLQLA